MERRERVKRDRVVMGEAVEVGTTFQMEVVEVVEVVSSSEASSLRRVLPGMRNFGPKATH